MAMYICVSVCVLGFLILYARSRSASKPNLPDFVKGTDFFTNNVTEECGGKYASTIHFMNDNTSYKRVINVDSNGSHIFFVYMLGRDVPKTFDSLPDELNVICDTSDEKFLFQVLTKCYKRDPLLLTWNRSQGTTVYCKLAPPNEHFPTFKWLNDEAFSIIPYEKIDKKKLSFFIPFQQMVQIDFRTLIPKHDNMTTIYSLLQIDMLCYTTTPQSHFPPAPHTDKNNFYQLFFPFVAEGFENVSLVIEKPINAQILVNKYDDFKIIKIPIPEIKLAVGDSISLSNQVSSSANGNYYVVGKDEYFLILQTYKHVLNFKKDFTLLQQSDNFVVGQSMSYSSSGSVWFIDLDVPGTVKDGVATVYVTRSNDNKYRCIPSPFYATQESCESPIDAFGNPKEEFMMWDRPCEQNSDCPFWQSDSDRGRCIDGYCEMPLGITPLGYTRYIEGKPFCHGCSDILDPECCDKQEKPDYAFGGDFFERNDRMKRFFNI